MLCKLSLIPRIIIHLPLPLLIEQSRYYDIIFLSAVVIKLDLLCSRFGSWDPTVQISHLRAMRRASIVWTITTQAINLI